MYPPPHMTCMYPPPHITCMYPPPHMTCMYPPPHMTCMYPPLLRVKKKDTRHLVLEQAAYCIRPGAEEQEWHRDDR